MRRRLLDLLSLDLLLGAIGLQLRSHRLMDTLESGLLPIRVCRVSLAMAVYHAHLLHVSLHVYHLAGGLAARQLRLQPLLGADWILLDEHRVRLGLGAARCELELLLRQLLVASAQVPHR